MPSSPDFSVVIPSYNHAKFLGQAVGSVLDQTHGSLELIVIDDGSRDTSREILEGVKDERLVRVFQENQGAHAAINRGLSLAKGELVAILNSDDVFHPDRFEKAFQVFKAKPEVVLFGSYLEVIDAKGEVLGLKEAYRNMLPRALDFPEKSFAAEDDLRLNLLQSNYWATTSNFIFRRKLLESVGMMRPLRFAHDWDFAFRVQRDHVAHLERTPLLKYRIHGDNTITKDRPAMVFEILWVLAQHLWLFDNHPGLDVSGGEGTLKRMEQLHNSIDLYGLERVFLSMLLFTEAAAKKGVPLAEQWLDVENPTRLWLLGEISKVVGQVPAPVMEGRKARLKGVVESVRHLVWPTQPSA